MGFAIEAGFLAFVVVTAVPVEAAWILARLIEIITKQTTPSTMQEASDIQTGLRLIEQWPVLFVRRVFF